MSKTVIAALAVIAVISAGAFILVGTGHSQKVVVYKSPTCGCCAKWVDHMQGAGYEVEVHDTNDMQPVKIQHGIKRNAQSCHTALVDGYVIEGHVPPRFIAQLLEEKPDIKGLAVPGMPIGSPGMEGPNPVDYQVVALGNNGEMSVYATVEAGS